LNIVPSEAKKSREAIADATARAAEANRIAEGERLARVKLEMQLASRHLTNEQKAKLIDLLTTLQPKPKTIIMGTIGDREANEYAAEIIRCVDAAGIYPAVQFSGTVTPEVDPERETAGAGS
jgi:hypothetical protein